MKFVKIRLGKEDNKEVWRLIIDSLADSSKYNMHETKLMVQALAQIAFKPEAEAKTVRQHIVQQFLNLEYSKPATQRSSPPFVIAKMNADKANKMDKEILSGDVLCINEAGGYCTLDGFLNNNDGVIIQVINKDDLGFPTDEQIINSDFLVLENDLDMPFIIQKYIAKHKITNWFLLNKLKDRDLKYTIACIEKAKTIALYSQFVDAKQLDDFFMLFLTMPSKTVKIFCVPSDREKITKHPLYNDNAAKHIIEFL